MSEALVTDKGTTREINQDYLASAINQCGDKIYILCDGMGGYKGGEVASYECSKSIIDAFKKSEFIDILLSPTLAYTLKFLVTNRHTTVVPILSYSKLSCANVVIFLFASKIESYNHCLAL